VTPVAVIGGGLAGSLLALELADLGLAVRLIDGGRDSATALSYGAVAGWAAPPTPLGRRMRRSPRRWRELQQRHGPLGWRPCSLRLNRTGWLGRLPLPCGQVEVGRLGAVLPGLLEQQGVRLLRAAVESLAPVAEGWQLQLADGQALEAPQVVLAAGAASRRLWPCLDERLRISWAGVLELDAWPGRYRRGQLRLPARFERLALERRAPRLEQEQWVVDPGLVPWGDTALVGQISLVRPGLELGDPPNAGLMEQRLRQGLEPWDPALARAVGRYRQAPVAFCADGRPLLGAVPGAAGLWQFTGFSAAFAQVPALAPLQAAAMVGRSGSREELGQLTD
jgi:glycine/D-amino acid oxidase-like deaminating enzyme